MTASPSTSVRVPGHTLIAEGSAHDANSKRITGRWSTTDGPGRGLCSCGALSDEKPSRRWRRDWHREHKAQVLANA